MVEIYLKWKRQAQQFDQLVEIVCSTFEVLARSGLDTWFQKGWSREKAERFRLRPDREEMQEELNKGANRLKPSGPIIGYNISYWDGAIDEESCSLSISCGGDNRLPAFLSLELAHSGPKSLERLGMRKVEEILTQMISLWKADEGLLVDGHMARIDATQYPIRLARLIYLKADRFRLTPQPLVDRSEHSIDGHSYIRIAVCEELALEPSVKCLERAQLIARSVERIPS